MDQPHVENILTRACSTCRKNIHPQSESFECTYCRIPICQSCLNRHDSSHNVAIVCVRAIPSSEVIADETCARCDKISFYRYSCLECVHSYCRDCWFDKGINTHKHRDFGVVETAVRQSAIEDQSLCCWDASFGHCDFCKGPLRNGNLIFVCQTCHKNYNELIFHCGHCQVMAGPLHDLSHRQWIWTFQVSKVGRNRIHCNKCDSDFQHIAQLSQHPHMSYTLYDDWRGFEEIIFRSYRRCWRKQSRHDMPIVQEAEKECSACSHKFPYVEMSYCQACNLQTSFCPHCTASATVLHYHPEADFVSFCSSPRSSTRQYEDLGNAMQPKFLNRSPSISQIDTTSGHSPAYAQRASPELTLHQSIELPNSPMNADKSRISSFLQPSQQTEVPYRASPVPTQGMLPTEIQNSEQFRRVTSPPRFGSTPSFVNFPRSLEPVANQRDSFALQFSRPVPYLAQSLQSMESLPQGCSPISSSLASPSSKPRTPQLFDSSRYGNSATSLSPASRFNFPRCTQSFNQVSRSCSATSLSPVSQPSFPLDKNQVVIRTSENARNSATVKSLETARNAEPIRTDQQKPSIDLTEEPPKGLVQIGPEPFVHSAFTSQIPPGRVIPTNKLQQEGNVGESNIPSAKVKATAVKWSKNKYVRAGAKLGAKMAISQFSNNMIGVDVSGVVDGVGQVVSAANTVSQAIGPSDVDSNSVTGSNGVGDGSSSGDDGGVINQMLGAMQNSNVQISLETCGDWGSLQNGTKKPIISIANRFKNRKHSGG